MIIHVLGVPPGAPSGRGARGRTPGTNKKIGKTAKGSLYSTPNYFEHFRHLKVLVEKPACAEIRYKEPEKISRRNCQLILDATDR